MTHGRKRQLNNFETSRGRWWALLRFLGRCVLSALTGGWSALGFIAAVAVCAVVAAVSGWFALIPPAALLAWCQAPAVRAFTAWYADWRVINANVSARGVQAALSRRFTRSERPLWEQSCRIAHTDVIPRLRWAVEMPYGWFGQYRCPAGVTAVQFAQETEALAAAMHIGKVVMTRDPDNAAQGYVQVWRRDPFASHDGRSQYVHDYTPATIAKPALPGIVETGADYEYRFKDRSLLVVGNTGSGKTSLLHQLCAHVFLCPDAAGYLVDLKGGSEFAVWRHAAAAVAVNVDEASRVISMLEAEVDRRFKVCAEKGLQQLAVSPEMPALILIVDEGPQMPQPLQSRVRNLRMRGRSVGFSLVWSTQRATSELLDTALRAMFTDRVVLRVADTAEARYARGESGASHVHTVGFEPGRGYAFDGTAWRLIRVDFLDASDLAATVRRVAAVRSSFPAQRRVEGIDPSQLGGIDGGIGRGIEGGTRGGIPPVPPPPTSAYISRTDVRGNAWAPPSTRPLPAPVPAAVQPSVYGTVSLAADTAIGPSVIDWGVFTSRDARMVYDAVTAAGDDGLRVKTFAAASQRDAKTIRAICRQLSDWDLVVQRGTGSNVAWFATGRRQCDPDTAQARRKARESVELHVAEVAS